MGKEDVSKTSYLHVEGAGGEFWRITVMIFLQHFEFCRCKMLRSVLSVLFLFSTLLISIVTSALHAEIDVGSVSVYLLHVLSRLTSVVYFSALQQPRVLKDDDVLLLSKLHTISGAVPRPNRPRPKHDGMPMVPTW